MPVPKKYTVCLVAPTHWSAKMGGAPYQVKCLTDTLASKPDYDVSVLTRRANPDYQGDGYRVISIASKAIFHSARYIVDMPKLLITLRRLKPSFIYQRVGCAYTGAVAFYSKIYGVNSVWHIASDKDVQPYQRSEKKKNVIERIEKKILEYGIRNITHIIAQTNAQSEFLEKNYQRKASAVIPNFHPLPEEKIEKGEVIKIIWIANFKRLKQPEIFIQLAKDLAHLKNAEFILIGAPSNDQGWQATLEESINALGNLKYIGEKTQAEVNQIIATSHILVNTSLWEGFSNTFVQAWMRRVPIVSLQVNPDNIFDDRKVGLISNDVTQLSKDVKLLVEDAGLREKMGSAAQGFAIDRHSLKNVESIVDLLKMEPGSSKQVLN